MPPLLARPTTRRSPAARLLLLLAALSVRAWGAGEALPVWEVRAGDSRVILLGSVHMARPETYPLREEIEQAFRESEHLVVEIDLRGERARRLQALMLERGTLPAGQSLAGQLPPATWERLQRYLEERGVPVDSMTRLQPALVAILLTRLRLVELGLRPDLGIDLHFLNQVSGKQRVLELESAEQQVELLLGFPQPALMIDQALVQMDGIEQDMDALYDAWRAGDGPRLNRLLREDEQSDHPEFGPLYEALFDHRNQAMTERVVEYLGKPGSFFVVVGAGHLVGPEGMIALLEARGYRARRI